ncbi:MAG: DUF2851 family protein [Bacteroidales bacterium]|nr:DUF2851 family protein [Bacteroidales bacterium]
MTPEKLLHYIWQNRLFYPIDMKVEGTGEKIEVINTGQHNTDAGPDFFNAQVKIGEILWAGNVEIHTTTDDWYAHGHDKDAAYDNVILHIVGSSTGKMVLSSKGRTIPEVALRYPSSIEERYSALTGHHTGDIHCAPYLKQISRLERDAWIDRLILERFEERNTRAESAFEASGCDWDQTFFTLLCRSMGFVVNAEPMEMLARLTPVKIMIKHNDPIQTEALLMGQAGLLPQTATDEYTATLKREYEVLRAKFSLTPMSGSEWKLLRLRPSNFPTIRLSQLAAIIARTPGNFENAFRTLKAEDILERLNVRASAYWDTHYEFGKESSTDRPKGLGKDSQRLLIINSAIPFIFAFARRQGDELAQQNIIKMLSFLPIEKNSRLDRWTEAGIKALHEGEAQALLLLYKNYCMPKKCLLCRWGHAVMAKHQPTE